MSSSVDATATGHANDLDHVLRPRPRKPQHAQVSQFRISSASDGDGLLAMTQPDGLSTTTVSGMTSGRSTPIPDNAPPSVKSLSSVRKLVRAEQRRRIFPTIEFASRVSHFDPTSDYRDFHGFFNLFWIGLAIMGITSMLRNMKDNGYPLRWQIWSLFTVKLWHLAVADFLMVATTAISLPLHRAARAAPNGGAMTWARGGVALQSIFQVTWLSLWIAVPFLLEWTWTSQVFFLLHTMVLLMKMHSYAFYNGHLSETEKRLRALDNPAAAADRRPAYLYPTADGAPAAEDPSGEGSTSRGAGKRRRRQQSRRRHQQQKQLKLERKQQSRFESDSNKSNDEDEPNGLTIPDIQPSSSPGAGASANTSGDEVETLRENLARELTSPMGNVTYPSNLTWHNYCDYILCPTLCYEIEYPRTASVKWTSLIAKIVATFGCIFLLTIISEEFILPVLVDASTRLDAVRGSVSESLLILAETISWLLFPFMLTFLLVFLVIFEYILGAFAEITCFGDRHFYSDWWNSTDWMEFSREWNVPVHSFLRRHVYGASRPRVGRNGATVITFLISAVGHEIVMACITKKLRGYGFVCQMLQLPIVVLQRTRWVRGRETLNNVCFWCSMILGLSLICALYVLV
ncbi:Sterol O-acyltransferase 2 (Sterol-ester synthase 2) [Neonectria magnoliae]|uniref:O-acyltransferase n=1 Tax=Neonectria magnoliae TaxID=2732573 RepID=A0ABR1I0D0_9HYPO